VAINMFCKNCGAQITENAKFCDACGTQTATEQANIQAQAEKNRQEHPPEHLKIATIITAILFGSSLVAVLFLGGDSVAIGLIVAGVFSAFAWILCIIQHNKFKKGKYEFDISQRK